MKIAFIVGKFPALSQTFILNQATGLIDRGHQVYIYTKHKGDWKNAHPDVEFYQLKEQTFQYHTVPESYLSRIFHGLWLLLANFHRAPKLILESLNIAKFGPKVVRLWLLYTAVSLIDLPRDLDIIHCQFGTYAYQGRMLQAMMDFQPKLLVMFRGYDISSFIRSKGSDVYDELFQVADACLTNCDFFRQRVVELGCPPEKIAVHYSGLDLTKFTYKPRQPNPDGAVHLVTTGRLEEKKGIEYAIKAIAKIRPRYPALTYTIVGDGTLRPHLEALVQALQLEAVVKFMGWQNEQQLITILDNAQVFIAPSVTAEDGNQDAPINVLKEAMAMGLPVISTLHGGIPELVQNGISGYLVPERDAIALADRLEQLLNESDRWPAMGKAGRDYVEQHFNLEQLNNRLVDRYESLLDPNAPTSGSRDLVKALI